MEHSGYSMRGILNRMRGIKRQIVRQRSAAAAKQKYLSQRELSASARERSRPPFIVTGIYRSGTSVASRITQSLGIDFGPKEHFLQPVGKIANLNPEGFEENFFFDHLGHFLLRSAGGNGLSPPSADVMRAMDIGALRDEDFWYFCTSAHRDDRIMSSVYDEFFYRYNISNIDAYIEDRFEKCTWGFKDVHAGFYSETIDRRWDGASRLVMFRDPESFLRSAKNIARKVTIDPWIQYYTRVLDDLDTDRTLLVSYDQLKERPDKIIAGIARFVGAHRERNGGGRADVDWRPLVNLVKPNSRTTHEQAGPSGEAWQLHEALLRRADNDFARISSDV